MAVIQRMANIEVLPLGNYANGSRMLGGTDGIQVADDVTTIDISIACCTSADPSIWPNVTTVLDITPQVSVDDAVTWVESGRSVTPGGTHLTRTGAELTKVTSGGSLPPAVNNIRRRYRCGVEISGGPLRSSMTVDVN